MANILKKFFMLIPLGITVYVVTLVLGIIFINMLYPLYDNAPTGYQELPKMILNIALYILPALTMIMWFFNDKEDNNSNPNSSSLMG